MLLAVLGAVVTGCGPTTYNILPHGQKQPPTGAGWQPVPPTSLDLPLKHPITSDAAVPTGDTPILVNIWASTCVPCKTELPLLQKINAGGQLKVIGFSRDIHTSDAAEAIEKAGVTYPNWLDTDASIAVALDGRIPINAVPTSALIRDGKVVAVHIGAFTSRQDVLDALEVK
jgi:cytochrome c biogenesis protein CcmG/thiol:disulfide interchange protein DsbE